MLFGAFMVAIRLMSQRNGIMWRCTIAFNASRAQFEVLTIIFASALEQPPPFPPLSRLHLTSCLWQPLNVATISDGDYVPYAWVNVSTQWLAPMPDPVFFDLFSKFLTVSLLGREEPRIHRSLPRLHRGMGKEHSAVLTCAVVARERLLVKQRSMVECTRLFRRIPLTSSRNSSLIANSDLTFPPRTDVLSHLSVLKVSTLQQNVKLSISIHCLDGV